MALSYSRIEFSRVLTRSSLLRIFIALERIARALYSKTSWLIFRGKFCWSKDDDEEMSSSQLPLPLLCGVSQRPLPLVFRLLYARYSEPSPGPTEDAASRRQRCDWLGLAAPPRLKLGAPAAAEAPFPWLVVRESDPLLLLAFNTRVCARFFVTGRPGTTPDGHSRARTEAGPGPPSLERKRETRRDRGTRADARCPVAPPEIANAPFVIGMFQHTSPSDSVRVTEPSARRKAARPIRGTWNTQQLMDSRRSPFFFFGICHQGMGLELTSSWIRRSQG